MARNIPRNIHLEVFDSHFEFLLSKLQKDDSLYSMLLQEMSELLNDDRIMITNPDRALRFLEAIKNSLQNYNKTFMKFLQTLKEYAEETEDPETEKLANDMYTEIAIRTSQDSAGM